MKLSTLSLVACHGIMLVDEAPATDAGADVIVDEDPATDAGADVIVDEAPATDAGADVIVDDDPPTDAGIDAPFDGNAPACPGAFPGTGAPCEVAEGQICVFDEPDPSDPERVTRTLCGCYEASRSERNWLCEASSGPAPQCPSAQPPSGESCYGLYGTSCDYPGRVHCFCSSDSGAWGCESTGRDDFLPPPDSVPSTRPVNALTDAERADWCDWYTTTFHGPGFPEPPDSLVGADGYTIDAGCTAGWDAPCRALVPMLPSSECEGNLGLSSCAAPISELSDCLVTVMNECLPSPHGCARYLEQPGCDGTIAVANTLGPRSGVLEVDAACTIRVR